MKSRAFGMVLASVAGTPLLAALLLSIVQDTGLAVACCIGIAIGGVIGAVVGGRLVESGVDSLRGTPQPRTELDRSLDDETRIALLRLHDKTTGPLDLTCGGRK